MICARSLSLSLTAYPPLSNRQRAAECPHFLLPTADGTSRTTALFSELCCRKKRNNRRDDPQHRGFLLILSSPPQGSPNYIMDVLAFGRSSLSWDDVGSASPSHVGPREPTWEGFAVLAKWAQEHPN